MLINIRPATWLDTMNITTMWVMMHQEITKRKSILEENSDVKNMFIQVLSRVEDPNWVVLVAEKENKTVGFIMGKVHYPQYSKCHIIGSCESLFVYPEHRGNGDYKNLVNEFIRIAIEKGTTEFELICNYDKTMIKFYDKLGYEPVQIVLRQKEA